MRVLLLACALSLPALAPGCDFENAGSPGDAVEATPNPFPGAGVGAACDASAACREGLACTGKKCRPAGDRKVDEKCLLGAECGAGLVCGAFGFCVPAGAGQEGASCSGPSECAKGLYCRVTGLAGFCAAPKAGPADLGGACAATGDCMPGLACSAASKTCVAGSLLLNPDLFPGIPCESEAALPFGVRTVVPRPGGKSAFYDLPFPSDVRRKGGRIDLADHPRPGRGLLGSDPLATVLDAAGDLSGFGVNPAVQLRFTRELDPATVTLGKAGSTVRFVDLASGADVPGFARFVPERNKYSCGNRLVVHPPWSRPLAPGRTYAVVVTRGVRAVAASKEAPVEQPVAIDDLPALLLPAAPADAALTAAWQAFAPLRGWMTKAGIAMKDVAGATVFTTGDPTALMRAFPAAAAVAKAPVLAAPATACATGTHSPCATPGWKDTPAGKAGERDPRDCPAAPLAGLTEVHARVRLPSWQEGLPPFLDAGGEIRVKAGKPEPVRDEDVCMAVSIPAGTMPAAGWPVVLYAHGTGGSYRLGVEAHAAALAAKGIAMVAIDQPMHGDRRGADLDPGPLFYNYSNPRAAKGNVYQGAADAFMMVRFVSGWNGALATVPSVRFDPDRVVYMGHSQGATTGALFLPYEDGIRGAVMSGCGGSLVQGLLGKKLPYDASAGVRLALHEMDVDELHPALHVLQAYFDETDAVVHGAAVFREPAGTPLSVLNVLGWDDSYTPWKGGLVWAAALGGPLATPDARPPGLDMTGFDPETDLGMTRAPLPIQGNVKVGGSTLTAATIAGVGGIAFDGHFVAQKDAAIRARVEMFVDTLVHAAVARVPE